MLRSRLLSLLVLIPLLSATGCSILFGNVRSVGDKAKNYGVRNLAEIPQSEWQRLELPSNDGEEENLDIAYQSKNTGAIVSLNSVCRASYEEGELSLRAFSAQLFLGNVTTLETKEERERAVDGMPALETTVTGRSNGERTRLRAVVLRKGPCVYDLMLVARPESFARSENDFEQFVASLRIR